MEPRSARALPPTAAQTLAGLSLAEHQWQTERLGSFDREAIGPDGRFATVTDNVIALRRLTQ